MSSSVPSTVTKSLFVIAPRYKRQSFTRCLFGVERGRRLTSSMMKESFSLRRGGSHTLGMWIFPSIVAKKVRRCIIQESGTYSIGILHVSRIDICAASFPTGS